MDMNSANIEEIVKQVLAGMSGNASAAASAPAASGSIPKTAHVAMLTALEHYDIKEFPIPEVGDDDILVKVEGCGVCGTDAHEFKRDPFGLIPVALGHEDTGEIAFLLAQSYMPAQDIHSLRYPLHTDYPWYYTYELTFPLQTPQYIFDDGSLKTLGY